MLKSLLFLLLIFSSGSFSSAQSFKMEDIISYPLASELTSCASGSKIAWTYNDQGKRNIYVAQGPDFKPRKLTSFDEDNGQQLSSISISADGKWVVFVKGGEHSGNHDNSLTVNPSSLIAMPIVEIFSVPFAGGEAKTLTEGDYPVISPKSDRIAFIKGGQIWQVSPDGSPAAKILFESKGTNSSVQWAPDGSGLAFVSSRGDHSFIGIFADKEKTIKWISPSFAKDDMPKWSPDGKKITFIRRPASGGLPDSILPRKHNAWNILVGDIATSTVQKIWSAPKTLSGSYPTTDGGANLMWSSAGRITFSSYHDGWPHLYSIKPEGGEPLLLTPGNFMCEYIEMSHDGKWLIFAANTGPDVLDLDRRHIVRVPVDMSKMEVLTPGTGVEAFPVVTGDGANVAMISSSAILPPQLAVMSFNANQKIRILDNSLLPASFPTGKLVTPKQVTFKASDGTLVYAQLFEPAADAVKSKKPAVVFVHGGPPRQMLLGWHYGDYYANTYAINQYLASQGFLVLAVNYRLGIGYGFEFHKPANAGSNGGSEYLDVKAAGEWLAARPDVDKKKIGIYGGSYGGYLTAMALGKDSKLFAAGVDVHGVHDWAFVNEGSKSAPDAALAAKVVYKSSPIAYVNTWMSPVLFIHGDDDRNVYFSQSVDLARRLEQRNIPFEQLIIPDDTHHWMKFSNQVKVDQAIAEFLVRKLMK
ncbi:S9 family peptidase [Dyadobacter subterraneus]|nr:prolyl oligopeptidase family serine peptidase [Dyadobacter subterraneus]